MMSARELSKTLAEQIADLPPGSRIDSEHALMRRFDTGRSVVRAAVSDLEARFLVRRVQGSGTYVSRRVDFTVSAADSPSFHTGIAAAGAELRTRLEETSIQPAPPEVADALGVPAGTPVRRLLRSGEIDGLRATLLDEWLTPGVAKDVDAGLGVIESVNEILRAYGFEPVRALSRATVEQPPELVTDRLGIDSRTPVWSLETHIADRSSGELLMVSRTWMRLDSVRLIMEIGAEP